MKTHHKFLTLTAPLAVLFLFLAARPAAAQGFIIPIYPTVTGDQGDNGWYVSDVAVSWDEPPPGATGISGCQDVLVDFDTAALQLLCHYLYQGSVYGGGVEIKRDSAAPLPGCNLQPGETVNLVEGDSLALDCSGASDNLSAVQASFDVDEDGVFGDPPLFQALDETVAPCWIDFRLSDEAGNVTEFRAFVNIANAAPQVTIVQVDNQVTAIGGQVVVHVDVEDAGINDTHTAFVDWGDGTSLSGWVVPTMISALPAHTYNQPGNYTVAVTISDDAGATSAPAAELVTVLDPLVSIGGIRDDIIAAAGNGLYNRGQTNSLLVKLDGASNSITRQRFNAAAGKLRAFAHHGFAITDPEAVVAPMFDLALQMANTIDQWVPEPP